MSHLSAVIIQLHPAKIVSIQVSGDLKKLLMACLQGMEEMYDVSSML